MKTLRVVCAVLLALPLIVFGDCALGFHAGIACQEYGQMRRQWQDGSEWP